MFNEVFVNETYLHHEDNVICTEYYITEVSLIS